MGFSFLFDFEPASSGAVMIACCVIAELNLGQLQLLVIPNHLFLRVLRNSNGVLYFEEPTKPGEVSGRASVYQPLLGGDHIQLLYSPEKHTYYRYKRLYLLSDISDTRRKEFVFVESKSGVADVLWKPHATRKHIYTTLNVWISVFVVIGTIVWGYQHLF